MRDDLEEKIRRRKRSSDLCQVRFTVLVSHRAGRDPKWTIIQGPEERVDLSSQRRLCQFLWKAPELASTGDRTLVVEEHAVRVAALAAAEGDGDHLPALGIIAEAVRIRHADEFVLHQRFALIELERLRHPPAASRRG